LQQEITRQTSRIENQAKYEAVIKENQAVLKAMRRRQTFFKADPVGNLKDAPTSTPDPGNNLNVALLRYPRGELFGPTNEKFSRAPDGIGIFSLDEK